MYMVIRYLIRNFWRIMHLPSTNYVNSAIAEIPGGMQLNISWTEDVCAADAVLCWDDRDCDVYERWGIGLCSWLCHACKDYC